MIGERTYHTTAQTDVIDITEDVRILLQQWKAVEGACLIFCPGSTASITTIEYEPGAVRDFKEAIERLVPKNTYYHHEEAWHDHNGYSHVRAAFMKPGITVPVTNGKLLLGTWQQIVLIDFDNRPRNRSVIVQFLHSPPASV